MLALFGPTAVGKTEVAIATAELLAARGRECVAVSADAYQLYRGIETLTGAPTREQRDRLEHLLVSSHEISEPMSAGRFAQEAREAIDSALEAGRTPIVVGGAGLYMQAALTTLEMRGPADSPAEDHDELRARLEHASPPAAARIDPGDRYRTARAMALVDAGGEADPGDRFWAAPLRRPTASFGLVRDRQELYRRIDQRVESMVAAGACAEVAAVRATASPTARKAIGFEELPEGRTDEMKTRTRRYAKRQLTWLRRMPGVRIVDLSRTGVAQAADLIADSVSAAQ